ncbi:RNA polymerase sigma-70 factor [Pedobacter arcticus]|uniref:RNA polymerase sigma-70 factor n=1 Tax=Pedobacter arcticus TaxID=752140 RepID=UPI0002FF4228|nr:RNA polymerase sigma-70 factor [Pedobacter arcticus]
MPIYSSLPDPVLLDLLKEDDEKAFQEIYTRYWKILLTKAGQKLSNTEEAEDILTDLFVSLWKRREKLPSIVCLKSYLHLALKYQVIKIWARRHQDAQYQNFKTAQPQQVIQDSISLKELNLDLKNAILNLPEKCRVVFELSREDGMSQKQIASILGISQKTVEAHISKALKTLKSSLRHHFIFFL